MLLLQYATNEMCTKNGNWQGEGETAKAGKMSGCKRLKKAKMPGQLRNCNGHSNEKKPIGTIFEMTNDENATTTKG